MSGDCALGDTVAPWVALLHYTIGAGDWISPLPCLSVEFVLSGSPPGMPVSCWSAVRLTGIPDLPTVCECASTCSLWWTFTVHSVFSHICRKNWVLRLLISSGHTGQLLLCFTKNKSTYRCFGIYFSLLLSISLFTYVTLAVLVSFFSFSFVLFSFTYRPSFCLRSLKTPRPTMAATVH